MKQILLIAFVLLGVVRCASVPSKPTGIPVTVHFTHHHHLELEPCGCSLNSLGGLERTWSYLNDKNPPTGTSVYFVAGQTFTPFEKVKGMTKELYRLKGKTLLSAFETLKVTALSPSAEDFQMGKKEVLELFKGTKVPLLSTNLVDSKTGKPLLPRYAQFSFENRQGVVLGVSEPKGKVPGIRAKASEEMIAETLAGLNFKPDFIVLLSDVTRSRRAQILKRFPEIHLVLGSSEDGSPEVSQYSRRTVIAEALNRGRSITRLEYHMRLPLEGVYNERLASNVQYSAKVWEKEAQLLAKNNPNTQTRIPTDSSSVGSQQNQNDFLLRAKTVPLEMGESLTALAFSTQAIDKSYEPSAATPLKPQLDLWKSKVRAIESEE